MYREHVLVKRTSSPKVAYCVWCCTFDVARTAADLQTFSVQMTSKVVDAQRPRVLDRYLDFATTRQEGLAFVDTVKFG
eukprot:6191729-Pleurochrysis_carterae.AAC.2